MNLFLNGSNVQNCSTRGVAVGSMPAEDCEESILKTQRMNSVHPRPTPHEHLPPSRCTAYLPSGVRTANILEKTELDRVAARKLKFVPAGVLTPLKFKIPARLPQNIYSGQFRHRLVRLPERAFSIMSVNRREIIIEATCSWINPSSGSGL